MNMHKSYLHSVIESASILGTVQGGSRASLKRWALLVLSARELRIRDMPDSVINDRCKRPALEWILRAWIAAVTNRRYLGAVLVHCLPS